MSSEGQKVEKYLSYAEELRVLAERLHSPEAREIVLGVVTDYERMARALQEKTPKP